MFDFQPPMLCKSLQRDDLDKPKWATYAAEPKHDGVRCLAVRDLQGAVRLYSRTGNEFTEHVPQLVEELKTWMSRGSIVDGELAAITHSVNLGRKRVPVTDFNTTLRVLGSRPERARALQEAVGGPAISFIVYDLPAWNGVDLTDQPQIDRRRALKRAFDFTSRQLFLNPVFSDPARFGELFDTLVGRGIEGIIIKNRDAAYVFHGRPTQVWYKVKAAVTIDLIVCGYTDGAGKYEGLIGAVEFARAGANGELIKVGRCSGMTDEMRRDISADRTKYLGQVIEVKSNDLVGSGEYRTPRHPQFVAFRLDKDPADCTGEELKAVGKHAA